VDRLVEQTENELLDTRDVEAVKTIAKNAEVLKDIVETGDETLHKELKRRFEELQSLHRRVADLQAIVDEKENATRNRRQSGKVKKDGYEKCQLEKEEYSVRLAAARTQKALLLSNKEKASLLVADERKTLRCKLLGYCHATRVKICDCDADSVHARFVGEGGVEEDLVIPRRGCPVEDLWGRIEAFVNAEDGVNRRSC